MTVTQNTNHTPNCPNVFTNMGNAWFECVHYFILQYFQLTVLSSCAQLATFESKIKRFICNRKFVRFSIHDHIECVRTRVNLLRALQSNVFNIFIVLSLKIHSRINIKAAWKTYFLQFFLQNVLHECFLICLISLDSLDTPLFSPTWLLPAHHTPNLNVLECVVFLFFWFVIFLLLFSNSFSLLRLPVFCSLDNILYFHWMNVHLNI